MSILCSKPARRDTKSSMSGAAASCCIELKEPPTVMVDVPVCMAESAVGELSCLLSTRGGDSTGTSDRRAQVLPSWTFWLLDSWQIPATRNLIVFSHSAVVA
jgi:hypothetical protein